MNLAESYLGLADRVFNPSGRTDQSKRLFLSGGVASCLALALVGCGGEITPTPTPKNVFAEPEHAALVKAFEEVNKTQAELGLTAREQFGFYPSDGIQTDLFNLTQNRVVDPKILLNLYNWILTLASTKPSYPYTYLTPSNEQRQETIQIEPLVCARRTLLVLPDTYIRILGLPNSATVVPRDPKKQKQAHVFSYVFTPDTPENPNANFETSARAHLVTEVAQSLINAYFPTLGTSGFDIPAEAANNGLATVIEFQANGKSRPEYLQYVAKSRSLAGERNMFDLRYPDEVRERIPLEFLNLILKQYQSSYLSV